MKCFIAIAGLALLVGQTSGAQVIKHPKIQSLPRVPDAQRAVSAMIDMGFRPVVDHKTFGEMFYSTTEGCHQLLIPAQDMSLSRVFGPGVTEDMLLNPQFVPPQGISVAVVGGSTSGGGSDVALGRGADQSLTPGAVTFAIVYTDEPNTGFNDPILGNARRADLEAAAQMFAGTFAGGGQFTVQAGFFEPDNTEANTLAKAYSGSYWAFSGQPLPDTAYPGFLAENLLGVDPDPNDFEFRIEFNEDFVFQYGPFGIMRNFRSIAYHEFGHGLGFSSSVGVPDCDNPGTPRFYGINPREFGIPLSFQSFPNAYDNFLMVNGVPIRFAPGVGNDFSAAALNQSWRWSGTQGNARWQQWTQQPNMLIPTYVPNPFECGSSISHVDEDATTALALQLNDPQLDFMSPVNNNSEPSLVFPNVLQYPYLHGKQVLGMFEDMGYTVIRDGVYVDFRSVGFETPPFPQLPFGYFPTLTIPSPSLDDTVFNFIPNATLQMPKVFMFGTTVAPSIYSVRAGVPITSPMVLRAWGDGGPVTIVGN